MSASFFFYDLETSGFSPRSARIVQFAGVRTDLNLKVVGKPVNFLIKLSHDVLPDPDAVLLTGITPQKTLAEGLTEAEFLDYFYKDIVKPETIFVGYNNIRFDDEFIRFINYRNFYDAYEWQWKERCSRWDILDVVRMTRALRPEGIEWPFAPTGKPTNRLEFLTAVNKLDHESAHDALSDVYATIAVARLVKTKQPDLFDYLFNNRGKQAVAKLVQAGQPFVYTSGHFSSEWLHSSVCVQLSKHSDQDASLVYDLRFDPTPFLKMNEEELIAAWAYDRDKDPAERLPIKTLKFNRCPAIAPLGVVNDKATLARIKLDLEDVKKHFAILKKHQTEFAGRVSEAVKRLDQEREMSQMAIVDNELTVDARLYDGFIDKTDATVMSAVRAAEPQDLSGFKADFSDVRLSSLLPLYKARNFPDKLTSEEREQWDAFVNKKLFAGGDDSLLAKYFGRINELEADPKLSKEQRYLLEELKLYGQSLIPADAVG